MSERRKIIGGGPLTPKVSAPLTREEWIYLWKTEGGNLPWARWAKIHGIPEHNPTFIEEAISLAKSAPKIIEKKACAKV